MLTRCAPGVHEDRCSPGEHQVFIRRSLFGCALCHKCSPGVHQACTRCALGVCARCAPGVHYLGVRQVTIVHQVCIGVCTRSSSVFYQIAELSFHAEAEVFFIIGT
jgi:hypothetical protein